MKIIDEIAEGQLTIFDEFERQDNETAFPQPQEVETVFELKDRVKIKEFTASELAEMSIEDAEAMRSYKGTEGVIISIHVGKVTSYSVRFPKMEGTTAYFYSRELILLG